MSLVLHFIFGFSTSFLGMVFPSMLNMTTVKISLERGKTKANYFAFGVATTVIVQAYIAVFLSEYLMKHPDVIDVLQTLSSVIFAGLAAYFFLAFKKDKQKDTSIKKDCRNTFLIGLLLSAVNMFSIPFYYGVTTFLGSQGLFQLKSSHVFLFVAGSAIGSFMILWVYPHFIRKISKKERNQKYNMNLILGSLTAAFSLLTLVRMI
ncbi:LysE family translocator [Lutimonas sp.]|uniref:LysE family translocator n=1 Tax=Lutimonas sp. TaxID=1872403 RepID=UPI003D9B1E1B